MNNEEMLMICLVVWSLCIVMIYFLKIKIAGTKINRNISDIMNICLLRAYVKTVLEGDKTKLTVQDHADQVNYMCSDGRVEVNLRSYCLMQAKGQYGQYVVNSVNENGWKNEFCN